MAELSDEVLEKMASGLEAAVSTLRQLNEIVPVLKTTVEKKVGGSKEYKLSKDKDTVLTEHARMIESPIMVSTSVGLTINLGNFESARVNAGISFPCKNDAAEIDATFKKAWTLVESEVARESKDVRGDKKPE